MENKQHFMNIFAAVLSFRKKKKEKEQEKKLYLSLTIFSLFLWEQEQQLPAISWIAETQARVTGC